MKFGKVGREDGCLFLCYKNTGIEIMILKREFCTNMNAYQVVKNEEENSLKLPDKSKIFVEQLKTDKERAPEIYSNYQKDILKLKLMVNENYEKLLNKGLISDQSTDSVKIHVTVEGLGPRFKILIRLTNEGLTPIVDAKLAVAYNSSFYKQEGSLPGINALLPFSTYPIDIVLENIDPNGGSDSVRVYIFKKNSNKSIAGTAIAMPISELDDNL